MIGLLNAARAYFWPLLATILSIAGGVFLMDYTITMLFVSNLFRVTLSMVQLAELMTLFVIGGLLEIYAVFLVVSLVN